MAETEKVTAPPAKPKSGKRRVAVIVVCAVLALTTGGVGAFMLLGGRKTNDAGSEVHPRERGLLALEPFVVNLADQGGSRFLRVSVRLVVGTPADAAAVQKDDVAVTRVRSAILELLTQQTADRLVTADGKAALKQAISSRSQAVLEGITVNDVLFSDFVVQF